MAASNSLNTYEKAIVALFLILPPAGGAVALYQALQNPSLFLLTAGIVLYICLLASIHIKWVRPYFRRFPWMENYGSLKRRCLVARPRHPRTVRRVIASRWKRYGYRAVFTALLLPAFVTLAALHGRHFWWFFGGWVLCGLGITIGLHRVGTHSSFQSPKPLRGLFLTLGNMAMQGPASEWLKKHCKHHTFGETSADPHSPHVFERSHKGILYEQTLAFLHSFIFWPLSEPPLVRPRGMSVEQWQAHLLAQKPDASTFQFRPEDTYHWEGRDAQGNLVMTTEQLIERRWAKTVSEIVAIERDSVVSFVSNRFYYLGCIILSIFGPTWIGGVAVWESLARICFVSWITYGVNAGCHIWGEQPFRTPDNSKNNAVMEILALGDGGHNTHHKSAGWAQHGVFAWQFDPTTWIIKGLERIGLVRNPNFPTRQEVVQAWRLWRRREPWMQGLPMPQAKQTVKY